MKISIYKGKIFDSFINKEKYVKIMAEEYSVVEMDTSKKWWDRWFVVTDLTINRML